MATMYAEQFADEGGKTVIRVRHRNGAAIFELRGGLVPVIGATFRNFERQGGTRSDDYIDGIVDALIHVAMTGVVPTIPG